MKKIALYVLMSASLIGCGSDDSRPGVMPGLPPGGTVQPTPPNQDSSNPDQPPTDSDTPPPFPEDKPTEQGYELLPGIYTGSSKWFDKMYIVNGLIDDNNRFWFINSISNDSEILGFANSDEAVKVSNDEFENSGVKGTEYSYEDLIANPITIKGSYKTPRVIEGTTFDRPSNLTTYKVTYNDVLSDRKQTLDMINNETFIGDSYVTGDDGKGDTTIRFSNNGNFTGSGEGCSMTGQLTLSASGRYFNANVKFADRGCYANGETHTGVALLNEYNELIVLGTNANKNKGVFFDGEIK